MLAYGTGTITGYTRSEWHDLDIKLIDSKQRPTEGVLSLGVGGGGAEGMDDHDEYEEADEENEDMLGETEVIFAVMLHHLDPLHRGGYRVMLRS